MLPAAEARQVRGAEDAVARAVGRLAGRCRPHLPEHERVGAARRHRADAVLRPQPEPAPHARQLRVARGRRNEVNTVWPAHPTPGVNRGYQDGVLRAGRHAGGVHGGGARRPSIAATGCRADLYGNVFVAEPAGNLVSRIVAERRRHDAQGEEGLRARGVPRVDRRALPARLPARTRRTARCTSSTCTAASSSTAASSPSTCATTSCRNGLEQPTGYGRIYRIVHDTTRRDAQPALSTATPAALVQTLSHPNGWWRDTAQRLLVEREDASVVPALTKLARRAPDPRTRLHALWTLDGMDRLTAALGDAGARAIRRATSARRRCACRSAGWRTATRRCRRRCSRVSTRYGLGGAPAARGDARRAEGRTARDAAIASAARDAAATIRSWSTRRSAAWPAARRRCSIVSSASQPESPQRASATDDAGCDDRARQQDAPSQRVFDADCRPDAARLAAGGADDRRRGGGARRRRFPAAAVVAGAVRRPLRLARPVPAARSGPGGASAFPSRRARRGAGGRRRRRGRGRGRGGSASR